MDSKIDSYLNRFGILRYTAGIIKQIDSKIDRKLDRKKDGKIQIYKKIGRQKDRQIER